MTIKEFSRLCGCNPKTIRYYDHVDLLKPVKVDSTTGYRYYDEDQALQYVKIKNLQIAGFSIEEIKGLLDADNDQGSGRPSPENQGNPAVISGRSQSYERKGKPIPQRSTESHGRLRSDGGIRNLRRRI